MALSILKIFIYRQQNLTCKTENKNEVFTQDRTLLRTKGSFVNY